MNSNVDKSHVTTHFVRNSYKIKNITLSLNSGYFEVVKSEGKLYACNEVSETLAKFKRIKTKKENTDALKFI